MTSCYNPDTKKAFIHAPRCAGTNISRVLIYNQNFINAEKEQWYRNAYESLAIIPNIDEYLITGVIRHPVSWLWSGYNKTFKYYNLSFKEHLECILNPWNLLVKHQPLNNNNFYSWYWHCCILPDVHLPKHAKIFKYENLNELEEYFNIKILTKTDWENDKNNSTISPPMRELSKIEKKLIIKIVDNYAKEWNYDVGF